MAGVIDDNQIDWSSDAGDLVVVGDGSHKTRKNNTSGGAAPTGAASFAAGYDYGSFWIWGSRIWKCYGDALWYELTGLAGGASSLTFETLSGTKNDSNKVFTFALDPGSAHFVLYNGQVLRRGTDYTRTTVTITLAAHIEAPGTDDTIAGITISSTAISLDAASDITNDSSVTGTNVDDALETLDAKVLPSGGTTGQSLVKTSGADYAVAWDDAAPSGPQVTSGVTAYATDTQGGHSLSVDSGQFTVLWQFSTVGATNSETMPAAVAGLTIMVINDGVNALKLYPATGDDLGDGLNTAVLVAAGDVLVATAKDATSWIVSSPGGSGGGTPSVHYAKRWRTETVNTSPSNDEHGTDGVYNQWGEGDHDSEVVGDKITVYDDSTLNIEEDGVYAWSWHYTGWAEQVSSQLYVASLSVNGSGLPEAACCKRVVTNAQDFAFGSSGTSTFSSGDKIGIYFAADNYDWRMCWINLDIRYIGPAAT